MAKLGARGRTTSSLSARCYSRKSGPRCVAADFSPCRDFAHITRSQPIERFRDKWALVRVAHVPPSQEEAEERAEAHAEVRDPMYLLHSADAEGEDDIDGDGEADADADGEGELVVGAAG